MTLLIWKLFLLFWSPAASLLISSSSPHRSLCPPNTVEKTCFDELDFICLPTFTTCTVFRESPQRRHVWPPEKAIVIFMITLWLRLAGCLRAVYVHWSVLTASQALCETDVASSEVPLEILALQKSLDPAGSANARGNGVPAKCHALETRGPDFSPKTLGLRITPEW